MTDIAKALADNWPGTQWTLNGDAYDGLVWIDQETAKPTEAEIDAAWAAYQARQTILDQIAALEATQTPRRMRDAVAGTDNGWLADLETQIAALRAQL